MGALLRKHQKPVLPGAMLSRLVTLLNVLAVLAAFVFNSISMQDMQNKSAVGTWITWLVLNRTEDKETYT